MNKTTRVPAETNSAKRGTSIEKCQCKNAWQDDRYGPAMRVHNYGKDKRTCTVCGRETDVK